MVKQIIEKIKCGNCGREEPPCSGCGGCTFISYPGPKKLGKTTWGVIKFGEIFCLSCGYKKGIKFFN